MAVITEVALSHCLRGLVKPTFQSAELQAKPGARRIEVTGEFYSTALLQGSCSHFGYQRVLKTGWFPEQCQDRLGPWHALEHT